MVSASEAQKRRARAEQKVSEKITKRGLVSSEKKDKQENKPAVSPTMMGFLMFVLFGSSLIGLWSTLTSSRV